MLNSKLYVPNGRMVGMHLIMIYYAGVDSGDECVANLVCLRVTIKEIVHVSRYCVFPYFHISIYI
jgi:hypothetical protein